MTAENENLNPYQIAVRARLHAQLELAKLQFSAFLWSIPLAAVMAAIVFAIIRWAV